MGCPSLEKGPQPTQKTETEYNPKKNRNEASKKAYQVLESAVFLLQVLVFKLLGVRELWKLIVLWCHKKLHLRQRDHQVHANSLWKRSSLNKFYLFSSGLFITFISLGLAAPIPGGITEVDKFDFQAESRDFQELCLSWKDSSCDSSDVAIEICKNDNICKNFSAAMSDEEKCIRFKMGDISVIDPYTNYTVSLRKQGAVIASRIYNSPPLNPGKPKELNVSKFDREELILSWSPPEEKNGPIHGYMLTFNEAEGSSFSNYAEKRTFRVKREILPQKFDVELRAYNKYKETELLGAPAVKHWDEISNKEVSDGTTVFYSNKGVNEVFQSEKIEHVYESNGYNSASLVSAGNQAFLFAVVIFIIFI